MTTQNRKALLGKEDPAPVVVLNAAGASPFLLIGDHAGTAIPAALGSLGLTEGDRARHIACDIGVRGMGLALSGMLDAAFVHQAYSRLVIDCNRDPTSAQAIPVLSDGTIIPGNRHLSDGNRADRIARIHAPYQQAIAAALASRSRAILVSLHSFTPVMAGDVRPWHVGVLHDGGNTAFARAVLKGLQAFDTLVVGDNAPYRMDETDHTVPRHAYAAMLDYVELEVRQDLIGDPQGQRIWAGILAGVLAAATAVPQ